MMKGKIYCCYTDGYRRGLCPWFVCLARIVLGVLISVGLISVPAYAMSTAAYETRGEEPAVSDSKRIQQLIDNTENGGVCRIPKGDYTVSGLIITRPIILSGSGNVILRYRGEKPSRVKPAPRARAIEAWLPG